MLMRRMGVSAFTVHGFRSAFRDWAGDETSFPRDVAEQALAHRVGDATERAYRRADALQSGATHATLGGLLPRRRKDGNVMPLRA